MTDGQEEYTGALDAAGPGWEDRSIHHAMQNGAQGKVDNSLFLEFSIYHFKPELPLGSWNMDDGGEV